VHLWDALTGQPLTDNLAREAKPIQAVAIGQIAERDILVAGASDGVVWAWEAAAGEPAGGVFARPATRVNAVAIGRAGHRDVIVSGGDDGTVRVWDGRPAQLRGNPLPGHNSRVETLAIGRAGDQDVIVSGGDDGIRIWDAATGRPIRDPEWMPERWRRNQGVKAVAVGRASGWDVIVSATHGDRIEVDPPDGGLPLRLSILPAVAAVTITECNEQSVTNWLQFAQIAEYEREAI
jgi:WD40 repeat protein